MLVYFTKILLKNIFDLKKSKFKARQNARFPNNETQMICPCMWTSFFR